MLLKAGTNVFRWRLLERLTSEPGEAIRWLCECKCGVWRAVLENNLRRRATQSCGCHRIERHLLEGVRAALRFEYRSYRSRARKFGREFTLSEEEFAIMMLSRCTYCNKRPSRITGRRRVRGSSKFYHQQVRVGGIDRMDSTQGYRPDNCTPCCTTCNFEKGSKTVEEYLAYRFNRNLKVSRLLSSPHAVFMFPSA